MADRIYKITNSNSTFSKTKIAEGDMQLSANHPLETLPVYESEGVKKVYWVDGYNQPRLALFNKSGNLRKATLTNGIADVYTDTDGFDFVQKLALKEEFSVEKLNVGYGVFPAGVIQYCYTYYNKYKDETNMVAVSELYYNSFPNRAGSPEEKVSNSFRITIKNADVRFDFVKLYSIIRTSIDATPEVKFLVELPITKDEMGVAEDLIFIDNNTLGATSSMETLLYVGGEPITAKTMAVKDNVLFFGNLRLLRDVVGNITFIDASTSNITTIQNYVKSHVTISFYSKLLYTENITNSYYTTSTSINHPISSITTLKYGETYRFGVQFQHKTGKWSEALWIEDKVVDVRPVVSIVEGVTQINGCGAKLQFDDSGFVVQKLQQYGYIGIRALIVYPEDDDRTVLCQGVLNPTLFNVNDRGNNGINNIASWYFRPMIRNWVEAKKSFKKGTPVQYRHLRKVGGNNVIFYTPTAGHDTDGTAWGEIQNMSDENQYCFAISSPLNKQSFIEEEDSAFYIDSSVVTLNSPDIEFSGNSKYLERKQLKMKIVGTINLTGFYSDLAVEASASHAPGGGFFETLVSTKNIDTVAGANVLAASPCWGDRILKARKTKDEDYEYYGGAYFGVYPWHADRSLSNAPKADEVPGKLQHKFMSNLRYSACNNYFTTPLEYNIGELTIFDSLEENVVKVDAVNSIYNTSIIYKGNLAMAVPASKCYRVAVSEDENENGGYPIGYVSEFLESKMDNGLVSNLSDTNRPHYVWWPTVLAGVLSGGIITPPIPAYTIRTYQEAYGNEPVDMRYLSTPHAVFSLNSTLSSGANVQEILPGISYDYSGYNGNTIIYPYWKDSDQIIKYNQRILSSSIGFANNYAGYLLLGELYRDDITASTRFGGTTQAALNSNIWIPCSETWNFEDAEANTRVNYPLELTAGDTYLQRYDCLKTYPWSMDAQQGMTEILSFIVETRVNLEGRYDRNKGNLSNISASPSNFNLINPVYSQKNNAFTYSTINYSTFDNNNFPTSFSISKTKIPNALVDAWTNVNLSVTGEATQDCGPITKIISFNDALYAFQKLGVFVIGHNSRTAISAVEGAPVELGRSAKFEGVSYLSTTMGCSNREAVKITSSGIYFIDSSTRSLYLIGSQGIKNVSLISGLNSWARNNFAEENSWTVHPYNTFTLQYNAIDRMLYLVGNDSCLGYSEDFQTFTSFYSYEKTPFMLNIWNKFISLRGTSGTYDVTNDGYSFKIWKQNEGNFNTYFGTQQSSTVTYLVNPDLLINKSFLNIEFRGDKWILTQDSDLNTLVRTLSNYPPINGVDAWNEYQRGAMVVDVSNTRRKLRTWRSHLPRVTTITDLSVDTTLSGIQNIANPHKINNFDRLKNNWIYLKLTYTPTADVNEEIVIHDLTVTYSI